MQSAAVSSQKLNPELYKVRPYIWLYDLVLNWSVIASCFLVFHFYSNLLLIPVLGLVAGARIHALALLGHDAAHRVAFRNRWLNDFICNLFIAWPLGMVMTEGYRPWHFEHHKTLGTEYDPELVYRGLEPYQGTTTWLKVFSFLIWDLAGFGVVGLYRFMKAIYPVHKPSTYFGPLLFWAALIVATFSTGTQWILFLWIWSLVSGFWTVFRFRTWTEHVNAPARGSKSSFRFHAGPIARFIFFPHNTHCHYEHHRWPQVPYYNLPQLRQYDQTEPIVALQNLFAWHPSPALEVRPAKRLDHV